MKRTIGVAILCLCALLPAAGRAADGRAADDRAADDRAADDRARAAAVVAHAVGPVMKRYGVPGMAVGVVVDGRGYVFDYGAASKATGRPVTERTLFEVGSVSKTFTATLAAYAQATGRLSLADAASTHVPALRGSLFDRVSLMNLATHTSGGLPLQLPDDVATEAQLIAWYRAFQPTCAPGTCRTYGNPGIGLLGMAVADAMGGDFATLEGGLFAALGMTRTYLDVPASEMPDYAQGYTAADAPTRMGPGAVAAQTYGVRTTAGDLLRFVEANMDMLRSDETWRRAVLDTHVERFHVGAMTQDLVWEQYPYPARLADLLDGNSAKVAYEPNPTTPVELSAAAKGGEVLIDKTGSTDGFGAYVAFVPSRKLGVVLLANRNYPIAARVSAAYEILTRLDKPISR